MILSTIAAVAPMLLMSVLPSMANAAAQCTDHIIPVKASATNQVVFAPNEDLTTVSGVTSFLSSGAGALGQLAGFIPVTGTYNISVRYCPPQTQPKDAPKSRATTVQFLLHGIPYNKNYWNGLYFSSEYSWIDYATSQGYPVFAIDNLGNGNSSRPDPVLVVQQPLQTALVHELITMLRAGAVPFAPRADKVVFVGHSIASVQGNGLATHYPRDADALILTGYTYTLAQAVLGVLLDEIAPASTTFPARYAALDPAYLTFASPTGKRNTYYSADGDFDPALPPFDYARQDTLSLGQLYSIFSGLEKAPAYTGDVLALTGEDDEIFCGPGSRTFGVPTCGSGASSVPAMSKAFFPNANFNYFIPNNTGHALDLHYSAQTSFQHAHAFLAGNGY